MKVILLNGSPRKNGNTFIALSEVAKALENSGIETEIISIGDKAIRGCIACGSCGKTGKCVFDDEVRTVSEKFENADGLVIGSPVYYASANGTIISFLDRLFTSSKFDTAMKVGASVTVARRSGTTATFDQLNKYFTIRSMPVVSSIYWNNAHGAAVGEAAKDEEGLLTMRELGNNMAFLIKAINSYKEKNGLPEKQPSVKTNFIR